MVHNSERGGAAFTVFLGVLFLAIIVTGIIAFSRLTNINPIDPTFMEEDAPSITWTEEPLGLGADPVRLKLRVTDDGSGLDEVSVRISQNNQPRDLLKKRALAGSKLQEIELSINAKELDLREGKAEIQILAFDQSLWSNGSRVLKTVTVDFLKPRIDVVTPQQNGVRGGSELVFYKVVGKQPDSHGVFSDGVLYPGFPAKYWDDSFKTYEDLYLAFFPIPQSFDDSKKRMSLLARDNIGNSASAPFNYRTRSRRWDSFQFELDEQRGEALKAALAAHPSNEALKPRLTGDLVADLRYLIKASARHDDSVLSDPLSRTEGQRLWSGTFMRPVSVYPANTTGDQQAISIRGQELVKGPSLGARFQVSSRSKVVAANGGRVNFSGTLPLSGTTIVIDHGFGLSTVYAHLSEANVKVGQDVSKGEEIGRTGTSGLAQSEEVLFEMRLHGVPVSPNEWWDDNWISDHILNKVSFVEKELLGGNGE